MQWDPSLSHLGTQPVPSWGCVGDVAVTHRLGRIPWEKKKLVLAMLGVPLDAFRTFLSPMVPCWGPVMESP